MKALELHSIDSALQDALDPKYMRGDMVFIRRSLVKDARAAVQFAKTLLARQTADAKEYSDRLAEATRQYRDETRVLREEIDHLRREKDQ